MNKKILIIFFIIGFAFLGAVIFSLNLFEPVEFKEIGNTPERKPEYSSEIPTDQPTQNHEQTLPLSVLLDVPFSSQAPLANWDDPRQQDGCEEASILMAWLWLNDRTITKTEAEQEIVNMSEFEKREYGNFFDLDAQDTAKLMSDYYGYSKAVVKENISIEDIKIELSKGNLVITPANGQKLGNPNFTGEGPYTHMVVVRGYDDAKRQFITNDPGTRNGNLYPYSYSTFFNALVNYPSGYHEPQEGGPKAMIIIEK